MITYSDFKKLDIRIGTILEIEKVPDADRLLKIVIDLGTEKRQIISGIAKMYPNFSVLIGKQVPILVNLEPRKFRGVESQGMILMCDLDDIVVQIHPGKKVSNGIIVR